MKKILTALSMLGFLVFLVACDGKGELESVTYGMENEGVILSMEILYDKDKNVQETHTKNTYSYDSLIFNKEQAEEILKAQSVMYKNMEGVQHVIDYKDSEAVETLDIIVKKVSKESLPVLFSVNANDDGSVSLDNLVGSFEAIGFEKKD